MTLRPRLILLVFVAAAFGGAPAHAQPDTRVLARIGADSITVSEFERSYVRALLRTGQNDTRAHRSEHLDGLIRIHLLAHEARRRGYDEDPAFRQIAERARRQALASRFYDTALVETLPPLTDAEIREAYARSNEQVILRHLYYRDAASAEAAHARLVDGRDFLEEAQDCYQLASFDSTAGYLGAVKYFQVDDAVAEAAFALDVGAFSAPVRSRFGYHILRVEEKIINPLLSESEYQTRKSGVAAQLRQRRRRLHGDGFVRAYMEKLQVKVSAEGIEALARAVENLAEDAPRAVQPVALPDQPEAQTLDVDALRTAFRPETPLARYVFEGEPQAFTAGDYFFWLEDLPFAEARQRPAASVGRALRNEVFARAALQRGLGADPYVAREAARHGRVYLAQRLQDELLEGTAARTDAMMQHAPTVTVDTALFEQIMTASH